ncbi:MAG TPA: SDR family oxidoreductase [Haloplasmataceae bacterium]
MEGQKTILITGASSGIGKACAMELAKKKHRIIILCRNELRGKEALSEIRILSGNNQVNLMLCDLSSFDDIKRFVKEFKQNYKELDILINNAGTMNYQRKVSIDGFELHLHVNYLAPFLLTNLLLDIINPQGRIINVSSVAHKIGKIDFNNMNLINHFSMLRAYSQSKLALTLFTFELARRLETRNITVNCLHPGVIISNLGVYKEKRFIRFMTNCFKWFFSSYEKGAETICYLADSLETKNLTGKYFVNKKIAKPAKITQDKELAKRLWNYTWEILKL